MKAIKNIDSKYGKKETYLLLFKQMEALIAGESSETANLANLTSLIHFAFNHHWTGCYMVKNNELILHNFQGPVACSRIKIGEGVCGTVAKTRMPLAVADVSNFNGHIACSAFAKSELVVPIFKNQKLIGVFDIDSVHLAFFDDLDIMQTEKLLALVFPV